MQVVTSTLGTLFSFNVKDAKFRFDYVASVLFSVVAVLELLFLAEVNFTNMYCIPSTLSVDHMVNGTSKPWENAYVNLICATEIRWARMSYYFSKIAVLVLAFFILMGCRTHIRIINQNACVLARQMLPQHLQDTVIPADIAQYEGFGKAYKQVKSYMVYKFFTSLAYAVVFLPILLCQFTYEPWREIIIPDAIICDGAMSHFNRERHVDFRCHLTAEWEAFLLAVISSIFNLSFFFTYCASVFTTWQYLRNPVNFMRKPVYHSLTPGHVSDLPDIEGAIAAICRIAKQTNPELFHATIARFDGIIDPQTRATPSPPPDGSISTPLLRPNAAATSLL